MGGCIKYWAKILQTPDHRYPKQCYVMLRSLSEAEKITWVTHVREFLYKYGFGYIWEANTIGDIYAFVKGFKQRLKYCCLQEWHSDVNDSPNSIYYCKFKLILELEAYLTLDLPYLYRKALANFRCSSHSLMIEKGRHQNIDRDMRFCPLCLKQNVYSVEDEFHFVCVCPSYKDIRTLYFKPHWITSITTVNMFCHIMSNVDRKSIMAICKFLVSALAYRKNLLQPEI